MKKFTIAKTSSTEENLTWRPIETAPNGEAVLVHNVDWGVPCVHSFSEKYRPDFKERCPVYWMPIVPLPNIDEPRTTQKTSTAFWQEVLADFNAGGENNSIYFLCLVSKTFASWWECKSNRMECRALASKFLLARKSIFTLGLDENSTIFETEHSATLKERREEKKLFLEFVIEQFDTQPNQTTKHDQLRTYLLADSPERLQSRGR